MAKNNNVQKGKPNQQKKPAAFGSYTGFCPLLNPGNFKWDKGLEIVNSTTITEEDFFNRFIKTRTPCIIRGEVEGLTRDVFVLDNLKLLASNADIVVEKRLNASKSFGEGHKVQMKFEEFVDKIQSGDVNHYMTTQPIPEDVLGYKELFAEPLISVAGSFPTLPQFIPRSIVPHQVNMWLGNTSASTAASSGLHHDFHDNVYLLLSGKKTFRLFSPGVSSHLPLVGKLSKVHPNGLICYNNKVGDSETMTPADAVRDDGAPILEVLKWKARGRKSLRDGIENMMKSGEHDDASDFDESFDSGEIDMDEIDLEDFDDSQMDDDVDENDSEGGRGGEEGRMKMPSDDEESDEKQDSDSDSDEDFNMFKKGFSFDDDDDDDDNDDDDENSSENDDEQESIIPEGEAEEATKTLDLWLKKGFITESERDIWNTDGFESEEDENSDDENNGKKDFLLGKGDRVQPGEKPFSFVKTNCKPRVSPANSKPDMANDILSCYLEVEIKAGDMLYLPASWFHEVLSSSVPPAKKKSGKSVKKDDDKEEGQVEGSHHLALNWWFFPPGSDCNVTTPYADSFWKRNTSSVLKRSYQHVLSAMGFGSDDEEGFIGDFDEEKGMQLMEVGDDVDTSGFDFNSHLKKNKQTGACSFSSSEDEEEEDEELDSETLVSLLKQVAADHPSESEDEDNASSDDYDESNDDSTDIVEKNKLNSKRQKALPASNDEDDDEDDDEEYEMTSSMRDLNSDEEADISDALGDMGFITGDNCPPIPMSEDEKDSDQSEEDQEYQINDNGDSHSESDDVDVYAQARQLAILNRLFKRRVSHHKNKVFRFLSSIKTAEILNMESPEIAVGKASIAAEKFKKDKNSASECQQQ